MKRLSDGESVNIKITRSYNMKQLFSILLLVFLLNACSSNTEKQKPDSTKEVATTQAPALEKFPTGEVIDKVQCKNDTSQSYALYLPKNYDIKKTYPVIYAFDPHSTGKLPVSNYKDLAEKYGYILIGSNNSQNGNTWESTKALASNMFSDSKNSIAVDYARIYLMGFSGGARIANALTLMDNSISGVICCGAANPVTASSFERTNYTFFGIAGNADFNYAEVRKYELTDLSGQNIKHNVITFDGKHEWPPKETMEEAFLWLELNNMRKNPSAKNDSLITKNITEETKKLEAFNKSKKEYEAYEVCRKVLNYYEGLADLKIFFDNYKKLQSSSIVDKQLRANEASWNREEKMKEEYMHNLEVHDFTWWQKEVASLNQQIKAGKNSQDAQIKKRLLGYLSLVCYMQTNGALKENNLRAAEYFDNMYVLVDPTNSEAHYFQAEIKAKQGDNANAIKALDEAVKNGFAEKARMENDSAFAGMKNEAEFVKVVGKVK